MIIPGTGYASTQAYVLVLGTEFGKYEDNKGNEELLLKTLVQPEHDYNSSALNNNTTKFCFQDSKKNSFQYGIKNATPWPSNGSQVVPIGFQPYQRGQSVVLACALPIYTEIGAKDDIADADKAKYANAKVSVTIRRATAAWEEDVDKTTVIYDSGKCANRAWSDGYAIPNSVVKTLVDHSVQIGQTYYYQYEWRATGNGEIAAYSEFEVKIEAETSLPDYISLCDSTNATKLLKIKFNEKIGSMKYNYADTVTATLGGEYPIVRRHGKQKYRTFTIEGLISQEANEDFITFDSTIYAGLDSYGQWATKELIYRNAVIDFLHNGAIKLYNSTQEGNMLIRLTNISLTPNDILDRNIWTFSATATEIAAATPANLQRFGFQ